MLFNCCKRKKNTISIFMPFFRTRPAASIEKIVDNIAKYSISALLIVGGFEVRCKTSHLQTHRVGLSCSVRVSVHV